MEGARRVAARLPPEMARGRKKNSPRVFYRVLSTREPTKCSSRTGILLYVLLRCCTAVVGCSAGSGWVVGALGGAWRVGASFRTWVDCFVLWG